MDRLTPLEQHIVDYVERYQNVIVSGVTITMIVRDAGATFPDIPNGRILDVIESLYRRAIIERTYAGTYEVPPEGRRWISRTTWGSAAAAGT